MKNIRSISTAALSIMLLLSTTASNGISFTSALTAAKGGFTSLVNKLPTAEQVTNAGKTAVETAREAVIAHPHISVAIAAPVVAGIGYGLYKAGKNVLAKRSAKNAVQGAVANAIARIEKPGQAFEQVFIDINTSLDGAKKTIVKMDKDATTTIAKAKPQKTLAKEAEALAKAQKANPFATIEGQANQVMKTVVAIVNTNATSLSTDQRRELQAALKPLGNSVALLPQNSDVYITASQFIEAVAQWAKSKSADAITNLKAINSALDALQAKIHPTVVEPVVQQTVVQRVVASLPSKKTALIAAGVTAVAVPAVIYAYKNGYVTSAIKAGSSLLGSVKNFAGFGKQAIA